MILYNMTEDCSVIWQELGGLMDLGGPDTCSEWLMEEKNLVLTKEKIKRVAIAFVLIVTILTSLYYAFFKWSYKHWERKNIPFEKPVIPVGSFSVNKNEALGSKVRQQYQRAKAAGFKEIGLFTLWRPIYFVIDPLFIKNILSIDFHNFTNRGFYYNKKADPLSANLFSLDSDEWKSLRAKLTPTFSSGKMKTMILAVVKCGEQLKQSMDRLTSLNAPINFRDISTQFVTDVGALSVFGIDCNSFENPNSDFITNSQKVFRESTFKKLKGFFYLCFPKLAKIIGISLFCGDVTKFFLRTVKKTVESRERNKIVRDDFLQLLINLKNDERNDRLRMTLEEIAAQACMFFVAGFKTSSSIMMFFLYELSQNQSIQEKVREEVNNVLKKHDGKVTYDAVMEMKYMKQTIDETLRKYPPVPLLFRQTNKDYKLPERNEILQKGTSVFIPILGLHYDSEYFSDPEKFDPDRFSDENKHKINPYTYLPFGEGPRNCIGLRFGIMQTKVGLIYLVKNYKFSLNENTSAPLEMDPASFILQPTGGVWLNVAKVE